MDECYASCAFSHQFCLRMCMILCSCVCVRVCLSPGTTSCSSSLTPVKAPPCMKDFTLQTSWLWPAVKLEKTPCRWVIFLHMEDELKIIHQLVRFSNKQCDFIAHCTSLISVFIRSHPPATPASVTWNSVALLNFYSNVFSLLAFKLRKVCKKCDMLQVLHHTNNYQNPTSSALHSNTRTMLLLFPPLLPHFTQHWPFAWDV